MLLDCAYYKDGSRQEEAPLTIEEAAARCCESEGFVWLGLHEPDPAELREVADRFDLPPLAVEDAIGGDEQVSVDGPIPRAADEQQREAGDRCPRDHTSAMSAPASTRPMRCRGRPRAANSAASVAPCSAGSATSNPPAVCGS